MTIQRGQSKQETRRRIETDVDGFVTQRLFDEGAHHAPSIFRQAGPVAVGDAGDAGGQFALGDRSTTTPV